jgi:hypothetical protein
MIGKAEYHAFLDNVFGLYLAPSRIDESTRMFGRGVMRECEACLSWIPERSRFGSPLNFVHEIYCGFPSISAVVQSSEQGYELSEQEKGRGRTLPDLLK